MVLKTVVVVLFLAFAFPSNSQVKLPALVADSMILQRDTKINIWGWASRGEKITVLFIGKNYTATTGKDGKWLLQLPPLQAGGPYTLTVSGNNKIVLRDVLVGDVWFCSGQSNMVHQMELHSVRYAQEIAAANYPQIRQFYIPTTPALSGAVDTLPTSAWRSANMHDIGEFSAVAYFFAKALFEKYHVPIGIINASVGGTPIEAWTSEQGLKEFPALLQTINQNKDTAFINDIMRSKAVHLSNMPKQNDRGMTEMPWYSAEYIPKGWRPIGIPGYWEDQGIKNLDGAVWYRKEVNVPAALTGQSATIFLGRIVDADFLYINGKLIGNTGYQYPQRMYAVPTNLLRPGKNIFVVRVVNYSGKGGFVPNKPYYLATAHDTIDLKGTWQYKVGEVFAPQPAFEAGNFSAQNQPSALFNAMVAPAINYTVKGMLWYQGESNTSRPAEYARLQPALITDWRSRWSEGNIPFLYVQLPGFGDMNYLPAESQWAELRQAQAQALSVPNTAMAVAIDLGEWNDIHPDRKKEVGDRLALAAEKLAYGEDVIYSGPTYESASVDGNVVTISFANTGSGLVTNDGENLAEFAIAGADKKFVWATASIEGNKVLVKSSEIKSPVYVRYAWADNPVNPNLYNKEGLPASPFEIKVK